MLNKDEIIRMAREAGFEVVDGQLRLYFDGSKALLKPNYMGTIVDGLKEFAALVAANERNRHAWTQEHWTEYEHAIAAAEREACAKESLEVLNNLREETIAQCQKGMIEAYKLGQSEEREACAKMCEEIGGSIYVSGRSQGADFCAAAIRARGE